jgi:hypothetical protein
MPRPENLNLQRVWIFAETRTSPGTMVSTTCFATTSSVSPDDGRAARSVWRQAARGCYPASSNGGNDYGLHHHVSHARRDVRRRLSRIDRPLRLGGKPAGSAKRDSKWLGQLGTCGRSLTRRAAVRDFMSCIRRGPVAGLVGSEGGIVSGVLNLESPSVGAPGRRPRHEKCYHGT